MPAERRQRLDEIGFVWDPLESGWEEGLAALTSFKGREGHCDVPALASEGTFPLGRWVNRQRVNRDTMSAKRRQRLDAIGFVWNALEAAWEEAFAALKAFKAREGHCRVPDLYIEGTYKLGRWIATQRKIKDAMPADRRQRLNEIGFVWDPREGAWEEGFAALKTFKAREGHCRVPALHIEGTFKLGGWIVTQRTRSNTISAQRRQRLDAIEFVWDPFADNWEEALAALTTFKAREGHCRAPATHVEGTFTLGQWAKRQRRIKDTLPAERQHRLEALGFVWDALESAWDEGFAALATFKTREGHCRVPKDHVEAASKLGQWVGNQRVNRDTMSAQRRERLDAIGFVWDARDAAWEEGFAALTTFKERERHFPARNIFSRSSINRWRMKMTALKSLTFTTLPSQGSNPIHDRRAKVIARLEEQKLILKDPNYTRTNRKWVRKDGERVMVEQQQRVPLWWRQHPNGSYALFVRSGLKPIEFEKGKPAIAVSSLDKLPSVIDTLITAVRNGELDQQFADASKQAYPRKSKRSA